MPSGALAAVAELVTAEQAREQAQEPGPERVLGVPALAQRERLGPMRLALGGLPHIST